MENKQKPVAPWGGGKSRKLIAFFTCIVIVIVSLGCYSIKDFGIGYKYYTDNNSQTIQIGVSRQSDLISQATDEALTEIGNNGYYIASYSLDVEAYVKKGIIQKPQIDNAHIKNEIKNYIKVEALLTKLTIKNDSNAYYFKTEQECNKFVDELNKILSVETSKEGVIDDYKLVTSETVLQQKLADADKVRQEAAAARTKSIVTSRGGTFSRTRNTSNTFPLVSYSYISSPYGMRHGKMHTGTDFAASTGTHILAWKSGKVIQASWSGGYGNFIVIDHGDGTVSRYGHCSGYACSVGQQVSAGQTIGYVGSTGNSTGPHLHFEIKVNNSFVNPLNYL